MPLNAAFQTDDLDAFDSDCDEAPGAQAILTAHLSCVQNNTSSDQQNAMIMSVFDAISDQVAKCTADNLKHKELDASLTAKLKGYKERVKQFEERQNVDLNNREKFIESQMNDIIMSKNVKFAAFQKEIDTLKFTLSKHEKENASLITKIDALKKKSKEMEDKYIDEAIDLEKQLENIIYKLRLSNPILEQPIVQPTPVKTEAPRKLPKELFNDFDKGLNFEINEVKTVFEQMEVVVDQCFVDKKYINIEKKELILDTKRLLEHIICQDVMNVVMHAIVLPENDNCLAHDNFSNEPLKCKNDHLMKLLISQDIVHTAVNSLTAINDYKCMEKSFVDEYNETLELKAKLAKKIEKEFFISNELQAQLKEKNVSIDNLKKHITNLKGKTNVECAETVNKSNVVTSTVYKLDLHPLPPRIKNNREAHLDYLKDSCARVYLNDVNDRVKSKSVKSVKSNKKESRTYRTLVPGLRLLQAYDRAALSSHQLYLEVAFQKHTCFVQNLEGVDLISESRDKNLYTISLDDIVKVLSDLSVWIYQKSQENSQKRANTDTGKGRAQKKPKIQSLIKTRGKHKLRGENDYSSEAQQDGKFKNVISRALIGSLKLEGHVAMNKAQGEVGFTLLSLTQLAQAVTSKE
ncbi:hypothetical protein Tco_1089486 [Tanacetum coccineum]